MTTPAAEVVLRGLAGLRPEVEAWYRDLHRHPELSHAERRTSGVVADRLAAVGCEVRAGLGGTGVAGVLVNGPGPVVLLRADMDALPVAEATGLDYASTVTAPGADGHDVPVMHACGHDVHVASLLGATRLLADGRRHWSGTLVSVFQPAEETGDGARAMLRSGLLDRVPAPDVALAQHVLPFPAGTLATRSGPVLSAADSLRLRVFGRGAHGSMPQAAVDPVVLASSIVLRLQTVVARELAPGEPAVVTVGSLRAGTKSNVIPEHADLLLNIRTYGEGTRAAVMAAVERIVRAECEASRSPTPPELEWYEHFPLTDNDPQTTHRVTQAFVAHFADRVHELPLQSASEDFSDLPRAFGVPSTYWGVGGVDPALYARAAAAGRVHEDVPVNHSASFAPVIQPTLDTAVSALVVAALAWLS